MALSSLVTDPNTTPPLEPWAGTETIAAPPVVTRKSAGGEALHRVAVCTRSTGGSLFVAREVIKDKGKPSESKSWKASGDVGDVGALVKAGVEF